MDNVKKLVFIKTLNSPYIHYSSGLSSKVTCDEHCMSVYHYNGRQTYSNRDHFGWEKDHGKIMSLMDSVVRIDEYMDGEYYPVWTLEEGFVQEGQTFIKLNGKYYSAKFLEKLLDKISDLKITINNINI